MSMRRMRVLLTAAITALWSLPASADFSDGTFDPGNWSETVLLIQTADGNFSWTVAQEATGGNPDAFRRVTHFGLGDGANNGLDVILAHVSVVSTHTPATDGAIETIDFSMDAKVFTGGISNALYFELILMQDGSVYRTPGHTVIAGTGWNSLENLDLTVDDFSNGMQSPDFSITGSPIQFGFLTANGTSTTANIDSNSGVDNWEVIVTAVPLPVPAVGASGTAVLAALFVCTGVLSLRRLRI